MYIKGLNDNQMTVNAGLSVGALGKQRKGSRGLSSDSIAKILHSYPDLDANWLLIGQGEMLKNSKGNSKDSSKDNIKNSEKAEDKTLEIESNQIKEETRPRVPLNAAAGALSIAMDGIKVEDCEQAPIIKAFRRYDYTIFANGDSMLPEYHSGDELACIYIKPGKFVQWGRVHVLDTEQGIIVKRIFKSEDGDYIVCRSDNSNYDEFSIHISEVYSISLVIGMIRRY